MFLDFVAACFGFSLPQLDFYLVHRCDCECVRLFVSGMNWQPVQDTPPPPPTTPCRNQSKSSPYSRQAAFMFWSVWVFTVLQAVSAVPDFFSLGSKGEQM